MALRGPLETPSPAGPSPLRRAELLAALSLAADLGRGQPLENAQRTAIVTVALGRAADLSARDLSETDPAFAVIVTVRAVKG